MAQLLQFLSRMHGWRVLVILISVLSVTTMACPRASLARGKATPKARVPPKTPTALAVSRPGRGTTQVKLRAAKNSLRKHDRGSLSTLNGIRSGQVFSLVNPTTGKVDHEAMVSTMHSGDKSTVPTADIKFSNGHTERYAAERLQLVGRSHAEQKAYLKQQRRALLVGIRSRLGVSPRHLLKSARFVTLRGREESRMGDTKAVAQGGKGCARVGPFLTHYARLRNGDALEDGGLNGFQAGTGPAYVSRHLAAFDYLTPAHEVLHAISSQFAAQMIARNMDGTMEGITDYFAREVSRSTYNMRPNKDDYYNQHVRVATQIANVVGERQLKSFFFGKGQGIAVGLRKAYDNAIGQEGAFFKLISEIDPKASAAHI